MTRRANAALEPASVRPSSATFTRLRWKRGNADPSAVIVADPTAMSQPRQWSRVSTRSTLLPIA